MRERNLLLFLLPVLLPFIILVNSLLADGIGKSNKIYLNGQEKTEKSDKRQRKR